MKKPISYERKKKIVQRQTETRGISLSESTNPDFWKEIDLKYP
jgi:hypothetical protein